MIPHLIVPGWAGSGADHWQTAWATDLRAERVELDDWLDPRRVVWIEALDRAITRLSRTGDDAPILIAHSLGCIAIAHWTRGLRPRIGGALLVAPADVERSPSLHELRDFAPVPCERLPFPTLVVTSDNDPMVSVDRAYAFAAVWGSDVHLVPGAGHINAQSCLGPWTHGRALLAQLHQRASC